MADNAATELRGKKQGFYRSRVKPVSAASTASKENSMFRNNAPSFEWDENKRDSNLQKHGIDFEDAIEAFSDPQSLEYHSAGEHDEARCILIGAAGTRVIAVIYTVRELSIRIISARLARREERERWNANAS